MVLIMRSKDDSSWILRLWQVWFILVSFPLSLLVIGDTESLNADIDILYVKPGYFRLLQRSYNSIL